jgi:NAD(P)-dependent dehydrogenase (short-subunit alcohol dehydrogenase family)
VVLTGGASALGRALARRLAADGARLHELGAALEPLDLERPETFAAFADGVAGDSAARLALVNVFAPERRSPFLESSWRDVERALRAGLLAPFELSRVLASRMTRAGGGEIVNVVPVSAVEAANGASEIAAVGGGLAALTRALARELRPQRIRVNLVVARTACDDAGLETTPERAGYTAGRAPVAAEDVAEAVAYLLDARSAAVIGGVVHVTGAEPTAR